MTALPTLWMLLALLAASARGTQAPHEQDAATPLPSNPDWAPGLAAVSGASGRVLRRSSDGREEFYFQGDAAALNETLRRFARVEADRREVVLLPTAGRVVDLEGRPLAFDWQLYAPSGACLVRARENRSAWLPSRARLDIRLGPALRVSQLEAPEGLDWLSHLDLAELYRLDCRGGGLVDKSLIVASSQARDRLLAETRVESAAQQRAVEELEAFVAERRGVELQLVYDERLQRFEAALVNRRSSALTLVLPGDGSEAGMRTPFLSWEVRDAESGALRPVGWIGCGTIDALREDEVVRLAPGERRSIQVRQRLTTSGRVRVVLRYLNDPLVGLPHGQDESQLLARVLASERLMLSSRPILVELP